MRQKRTPARNWWPSSQWHQQMRCTSRYVLSMSVWSVSLYCSSAKQASRQNGHAQYKSSCKTHLPIPLSANHLRCCCCHNHFEKQFCCKTTPILIGWRYAGGWSPVSGVMLTRVTQYRPGAGYTLSKPRVLIKKSDTTADTFSRDTLVHHSLNFEHKVSVWLLQLINIGSSLSRRHRDNFYKVWRHSLVSSFR